MLAFMSNSSPLPDVYPTSSMATSTMSLAILPSAPMSYSQVSVPTLLAPLPSKRPKLSLNTSQTPILLGGKGSNSLRLETLSEASPTVRNTFSNGYNPAHALKLSGPKPQRPVLTPLATSSPSHMIDASFPAEDDVPSLTNSATSSSAGSTTSESTDDSLSNDAPCKPTFTITSILSNGPSSTAGNKRSSFAQSRPMFPVAKKVSFRAPLTENIWNIKFTMAHSDIDTLSMATKPEVSLAPLVTQPKEQVAMDDTECSMRARAVPSIQTGEKRESSDEEDSDTCPVTPVAGRRKRHREWRWTLGAVESGGKENGVNHILPDRALIFDEDDGVGGDCQAVLA